jgi:large subunit ribosomal protein L15
MQIHSLKRRHPNKTSTQVGRGGTRGKTSGKGTKGQNARSGRKKYPEIRDVIKRLPKLRGRGKNSNLSIQTKFTVVNLGALGDFKNGETVNPTTLVEKGIVRKQSGALPKVKILGNGSLSGKLTFQSCAVSMSARKKIEALGGIIE